MELLLVILTTGRIHGDDFPFLCPYKVPDGSPRPSKSGIEGGGLLPLISEEDLTNADGGVFGQYKAALAMVPCDAQALSVFTSPLIKMNNAVSVIFVYNKPIEELKRWLEYVTISKPKNKYFNFIILIDDTLLNDINLFFIKIVEKSSMQVFTTTL